jgi:hypothetical protein
LGGDKPDNEIQTPLAAVILGGLFSSTALNMVVLPTLYLRFGQRRADEGLTGANEFTQGRGRPLAPSEPVLTGANGPNPGGLPSGWASRTSEEE